MSHVAIVTAQIKDLDAMAEAAEKLGGELRLGQTQFHYFAGQKSACDHAIRLRTNASHEVGLIKRPDGDGYQFGFDNYGTPGRALENAFGTSLVGLQNEYLAVVGERWARQEGYMVQRVEEQNQIRLVAMR